MHKIVFTEERYDLLEHFILNGRIQVDIKNGLVTNLKMVKSTSGYMRIAVKYEGKNVWYSVHHIIGYFIFGSGMVGYQINHKNGRKEDNFPSNLEISTPSENTRHAYKNKLASQTGSKNGGSKLKERCVKEIKDLYKNKVYNQYEIADLYGISQGNVGHIVRGVTWKHVL